MYPYVRMFNALIKACQTTQANGFTFTRVSVSLICGKNKKEKYLWHISNRIFRCAVDSYYMQDAYA